MNKRRFEISILIRSKSNSEQLQIVFGICTEFHLNRLKTVSVSVMNDTYTLKTEVYFCTSAQFWIRERRLGNLEITSDRRWLVIIFWRRIRIFSYIIIISISIIDVSMCQTRQIPSLKWSGLKKYLLLRKSVQWKSISCLPLYPSHWLDDDLHLALLKSHQMQFLQQILSH